MVPNDGIYMFESVWLIIHEGITNHYLQEKGLVINVGELVGRGGGAIKR